MISIVKFTFDLYYNYHIAGKFGELTLFEPLVKESLQINRTANRLLIVSTNLNGFSLVNHGRFAKFAKLSRYTVQLNIFLYLV